MQADPCIIAGNNPAVFRGFRANNFIFAGLHGNLLGCEVNFPSGGFCPSGPSGGFCPSGPSLSDKVYSWISSQYTKCSLFCKARLCLSRSAFTQCRVVICPRSAGQTCLGRAGVTCPHCWTDDLNTDITSRPTFHNPALKRTRL